MLFALLRTGRADNLVDNVGSGGLISFIDIESGIVSSDGFFNHTYYERHPDTNEKFYGSQIPAWSELLSLVESAHRSLHGQSLIGWDFAWAENYYDLVEMNPAPSFDSFQIFTDHGIRPLLKRYKLI